MNYPSVRINGPYGVYLTYYQGKKYIFFNDYHVNYKALPDPRFGQDCKPCENNECIDIVDLLSLIFRKSEEKNEGSEFYIEEPFTKQSNLYASVKTVPGYLDKLTNFFNKCFSKNTDCGYKNTLFHYADIRKEWESVEFEELYHDIPHIPVVSPLAYLLQYIFEGDPYIFKWIGYEYYIIDKISELVDKIKKGETLGSNKLKTVINKIFFEKTAGKNLGYNLYKLYLTSDDIEKDISTLFKGIQIDKKLILPSSMIVKRGEKNVHRIRSQILDLQNEGREALVDKIISFILDKYEQNLSLVIPKLRDVMNSLDIIEKKMTETKKLSTTEYFETLDNAMRRVGAAMMTNGYLIMDAYTLPRMLRNFVLPGTNIKTTKKIVYAGGAHNQTYAEFFEKMLNVRVVKYLNEDYSKCVNVYDKDYSWMVE